MHAAAALVAVLALAGPADHLSMRTARAKALGAERAQAKRIAPKLGRHVKIVRSHVGRCTRRSATVIDCRAATTYLVAAVDDPGLYLADKTLTRSTWRISSPDGPAVPAPR